MLVAGPPRADGRHWPVRRRAIAMPGSHPHQRRRGATPFQWPAPRAQVPFQKQDLGKMHRCETTPPTQPRAKPAPPWRFARQKMHRRTAWAVQCLALRVPVAGCFAAPTQIGPALVRRVDRSARETRELASRQPDSPWLSLPHRPRPASCGACHTRFPSRLSPPVAPPPPGQARRFQARRQPSAMLDESIPAAVCRASSRGASGRV